MQKQKQENRVAWQDCKVDTFTFGEIIGQDGYTAMMAQLHGYKIIKDRKKGK